MAERLDYEVGYGLFARPRVGQPDVGQGPGFDHVVELALALHPLNRVDRVADVQVSRVRVVCRTVGDAALDRLARLITEVVKVELGQPVGSRLGRRLLKHEPEAVFLGQPLALEIKEREYAQPEPERRLALVQLLPDVILDQFVQAKHAD